jgi:murein DD-endopeptidase MepM/ murein hydrolase activator NlpD
MYRSEIYIIHSYISNILLLTLSAFEIAPFMGKQQKRSISKRFRDKFRLIIYNDITFEEVWYIRLSRFNLMALLSSLFLLIIGGVFALVAFTSIRELIPGYPDGNMRRTIYMNAVKLDSLENEIRMRDQYFRNIRALVAGEEPDNLVDLTDTTTENSTLDFSTSFEDSILRIQIEEEEQYNLSVLAEAASPKDLAGIHFFTPVRGLITQSFNSMEEHYGTDIGAAVNEVVKATLGGTVTMADWTVETGYTISIMHENNLLSVYKHNAELLKKIGNKVKAGDAIAIIGNSGELTTGPHLHFELWHNGTPIDPQTYIVF